MCLPQIQRNRGDMDLGVPLESRVSATITWFQSTKGPVGAFGEAVLTFFNISSSLTPLLQWVAETCQDCQLFSIYRSTQWLSRKLLSWRKVPISLYLNLQKRIKSSQAQRYCLMAHQAIKEEHYSNFMSKERIEYYYRCSRSTGFFQSHTISLLFSNSKTGPDIRFVIRRISTQK